MKRCEASRRLLLCCTWHNCLHEQPLWLYFIITSRTPKSKVKLMSVCGESTCFRLSVCLYTVVHTQMCVQNYWCMWMNMLLVLCRQPLLVLPALSSPHLQKINPFSNSVFFLKHSQRISFLTLRLSSYISHLIPSVLPLKHSSAFNWFN